MRTAVFQLFSILEAKFSSQALSCGDSASGRLFGRKVGMSFAHRCCHSSPGNRTSPPFFAYSENFHRSSRKKLESAIINSLCKVVERLQA